MSLEEQLLLVMVDRERNLKNMLMILKKGWRSLKEYLRDFKNICDNFKSRQSFHIAHGLWWKYKNFRFVIFDKLLYYNYLSQ